MPTIKLYNMRQINQLFLMLPHYEHKNSNAQCPGHKMKH